MSKVLVTGGAGFIGSHLVEYLVNRGDNVIVIDDLSTGKLENIYSFCNRVIIGSVQTFSDSVVRDVDYVFHLAASVGVKNIFENPSHCIKNNIRSTDAVLELCLKHHKKVLITSTSEVYGLSPFLVQKEYDKLVYFSPDSNMRLGYAVSKLVCELTTLGLFRESGLRVIITRLFNTIGKRQVGMYGMVVPRFIESAKRGDPLIIYGDGTQVRTFVMVDDVVKALCLLMDTDKAIGSIFNVGGTCTISINSLAQNIIRLTSSTSKIIHVEYSSVFGNSFKDIKSRIPSLEKVKSVIDYCPESNLDKMLLSIINV